MLRTMDVGRLAIMPIFVWMLILNGSNLVAHADERSPLATAGTAAALAFYLVLAVQYLRRGSASRTDRRPVVWFVALAATFAPFAIPLVSPDGAVLVRDAGLGSLFVLLGLVGALWAAVALGRNISVVPQARSVASSGPYRHFRHPLYAFELVAALGLVILSGGGWGWRCSPSSPPCR